MLCQQRGHSPQFVLIVNTVKSREIHIRQGKVTSIALSSTAAAACA
jgi:hypothetical protein